MIRKHHHWTDNAHFRGWLLQMLNIQRTDFISVFFNLKSNGPFVKTLQSSMDTVSLSMPELTTYNWGAKHRFHIILPQRSSSENWGLAKKMDGYQTKLSQNYMAIWSSEWFLEPYGFGFIFQSLACLATWLLSCSWSYRELWE